MAEFLCKVEVRGAKEAFTSDAARVVSRSRLPEATWAAFCCAFAARATLGECAEERGVSLKTAWYMRMHTAAC